MWTLSRPACRRLTIVAFNLISVASCLMVNPALADSNSYYQNNAQFGMQLPYASMPNGQDEIRTAEGTSCRSAVGGDGTYLDSGVIGTPGGNDLEASAAIYSRIVVPLGSKAKRLDCSRLYDLEIRRLKMELDLARMGLQRGAITGSAETQDSNWANEGWSNGTPQPASAPASSHERFASKKIKLSKVPATKPDLAQQDVITGSLY